MSAACVRLWGWGWFAGVFCAPASVRDFGVDAAKVSVLDGVESVCKKWWLLFLFIRQLLLASFIFFWGKLSGRYLVFLLIPLKRLIWFLGTGAWDKISEKHAVSTYFLGLEFIINSKVTLKMPTAYASNCSSSRTCPGTSAVQWWDPLGSVNHSQLLILLLFAVAVCYLLTSRHAEAAGLAASSSSLLLSHAASLVIYREWC